MIARTEPACLLIADIAGYSGHLAGVELDHAQDILGDPIDTVVRPAADDRTPSDGPSARSRGPFSILPDDGGTAQP